VPAHFLLSITQSKFITQYQRIVITVLILQILITGIRADCCQRPYQFVAVVFITVIMTYVRALICAIR